MQSFQLLSPGERRATMFAAFAVSLAVLTATLLSFAGDSDTPWFDAGSDLAAAAQRCDAAAQSSQRHRCLREVAQAAARQASAPTLLARRH